MPSEAISVGFGLVLVTAAVREYNTTADTMI